MSIRFIQEHIAKNGAKDVITKNFDKESVLFGRTGDCDILLSGESYALKQARITREGNEYYLEALDPIFEVTLNGKLVQRQKLSHGDTFALSGTAFSVSQAGSDLEITQRTEEDSASPEEQRERLLRALDVRHALPSFKSLSLMLVLAVLGWVWVYPLLAGEKRHLQSGPVTNHHRMIEHDCSSCHTGNFERVADRACQSCHSMSDHAPVFQNAAHQQALGRLCVDCHREHGGVQSLLPPEPALCTGCHAQIKQQYPDSKIENVSSWDRHPEFSMPEDNSHIKLNHEIHLKPDLKGRDGPVTLQCGSCHELSADFKTIAPISMEKHCASCHGLQFDERLPDTQVPHAEPDIVYKFLYAEYAKFLLADSPQQQSAPIRLKPGAALPQAGAAHTSFVRGEVESLARAAERELFTRTACQLCHEISETEDPDAISEQRSRYAVLKPEIPEVWMAGARFGHGSHEELSCESCHTGVRNSSQTSDVLLPGRNHCQHCHADSAGSGKLESNCVLCHSYHDSLALDPGRKKNWKLGAP